MFKRDIVIDLINAVKKKRYRPLNVLVNWVKIWRLSSKGHASIPAPINHISTIVKPTVVQRKKLTKAYCIHIILLEYYGYTNSSKY